MNATPDEPGEQVGDQLSSDDLDRKQSMLEFTYKEVLDATKHQDDKIGRLLTVIAFLTAGVLGLANLAGGRRIDAIFLLGQVRLPLVIICLSAFLFSILITVILLLVSFATPLRLPGDKPEASRPDVGAVQDVRVSQLYFSEISKISLREWRHKWDGTGDVDALKRERFDAFVRETHNLSVRTNFKYDRTTEAISVFAIALLAFALGVAFTCIATVSPETGDATNPIRFGGLGPVLLAAVLGVYTFVQLLGQQRYRVQDVDDVYPPGDDVSLVVRVRGELLLVGALPAAIGSLVLVTSDWPRWLAVGLVVATMATTLLALFMRIWSGPNRVVFMVAQAAKLAWAVPVLVAAGVIGIRTGAYWIQVVAAVLAAVGLFLLGALSPTLIARRRRRSYLDRRAKAKKDGIDWAKGLRDIS